MKSVFRPVVFPLEIGVESAELAEAVGAGFGPPSVGLSEACMKDVVVVAFNQDGADEEVARQGLVVVELVRAITEVTQGSAHGGVSIRRREGLCAQTQSGEDVQMIAGAEQLAHRADEGLSRIECAASRGPRSAIYRRF